LTGKVLIVKNFFNKLERGVRYYRFFLTHKQFDSKFSLKILDFFVNKFIYFTNKRFIDVKLFDNIYYIKISNLEYYSNIRLSNSFYSSKLNDILYIRIQFNELNKKNIKYFLGNFKFIV
jgi:hypothetical protein